MSPPQHIHILMSYPVIIALYCLSSDEVLSLHPLIEKTKIIRQTIIVFTVAMILMQWLLEKRVSDIRANFWRMLSPPCGLHRVQILYFCQKGFCCFHVFRVREAAVYRANSCTLWFVVKALAFSAFIWNNVVVFRRPEVAVESAGRSRIVIFLTVKFPNRSCFIDCSVGTFGFARPAIDAVGGNIDCHSSFLWGYEL